MKKVTSTRVAANSSRAYLQEVKSIVPFDAMWVGVKTDQLVQEIEFEGTIGYQLGDGTVLTLQDHSWNDMMDLGQEEQEYASFNSPIKVMETKIRNYQTPTVGVRFGCFDEVYKVGWVVFPLEAYKGFNNKPIILRKVRVSQWT